MLWLSERRSGLKTRRNRGFTLIEILLVILLLGLLATVLIVSLGGTRESSEKKTCKLIVENTIPFAMERYYFDIHHYPSEEEGGIKALVEKPQFSNEDDGKNWSGPYLPSVPKDPWGHEFHYEVVTATGGDTGGRKYKIWSDGPDGQSGTEDDIKNYDDTVK
jgi:general secretion pathway protein G